jgi:hypothetical protein
MKRGKSGYEDDVVEAVARHSVRLARCAAPRWCRDELRDRFARPIDYARRA